MAVAPLETPLMASGGLAPEIEAIGFVAPFHSPTGWL